MPALRALIVAAVHSCVAGAAGVVYLIRHGEKKSTLGDLSEVGLARAQYIAQLFDDDKFRRPKALLAAKYSSQPQRTKHTIEPLAAKLNLNIDNDIHTVEHKHAAKAITDQLLAGNDVVLACWEHLNMHGVCKELGVDKHVCGDWDGDDYDSVYELTFDSYSPTFEHKYEGFSYKKHSLTTTAVHAYPNSMGEAAAFAKSYYENQMSVDVGLCDHFVAVWYGLAHSGFADATAHWNSIPASYKLGGWQPGALAFWSGGSHGHVAIGDVKLGRVYSTDYPTKGYVGHKEVGDISSAWGFTFLGWTKPFFNTGADSTLV